MTDNEEHRRQAQEAHDHRVASWKRQHAEHKAARDAEFEQLVKSTHRDTEQQNAEWEESARNRIGQLSEPRSVRVVDKRGPPPEPRTITVEVVDRRKLPVEPIDLDDL